MELHATYDLTPVINLSGPLTTYGASISSEGVCEAVAEALRHQWDMEQLFARAGTVIAAWSGAEAGTLTACAASGVTLSVAAYMTGNDLGKVSQLPDATGMKSEVLVQKGHSVNFGAPLEQVIRLAGATVREVGTVNQTRPHEVRAGLNERTAAAMFVVSHHTSQFGYVQLDEFIALCHAADVPVIIDAAAQDHQIERLVAAGADLIVFSGQKYLSGPTSGIVCGRRDLVEAVYLQNRGIGRTMKLGKEAIFGMMVALEERMATNLDDWAVQQREKAAYLADRIQGLTGVAVSLERDRVGHPGPVVISMFGPTTGAPVSGSGVGGAFGAGASVSPWRSPSRSLVPFAVCAGIAVSGSVAPSPVRGPLSGSDCSADGPPASPDQPFAPNGLSGVPAGLLSPSLVSHSGPSGGSEPGSPCGFSGLSSFPSFPRTARHCSAGRPSVGTNRRSASTSPSR